jgi:hypothetical protein
VQEEHRKWAKKVVVRKRIWKEAEGMLLDGMTKEELYVSWNSLMFLRNRRKKLTSASIG